MKTQRKSMIYFLTFAVGALLLLPLLAYANPFGEPGSSGNREVGWDVVYLTLPFVFFVGMAFTFYFVSGRRSELLGPPAHDPRHWKE